MKNFISQVQVQVQTYVSKFKTTPKYSHLINKLNIIIIISERHIFQIFQSLLGTKHHKHCLFILKVILLYLNQFTTMFRFCLCD